MSRRSPRMDRFRGAARDRALDALTENVGYKVLAIGFALAIWAWVQSEKVVEKRTRARVHYVWPSGLVRAVEVPRTLVLTVEGAQGRLRKLGDTQLSVTVDLSDAVLGSNAVDFSQRTVEGIPQGVSVIQVSPPAADITLDRAMTRTVRIKPVTIGDIDPRCRLVSVTAYPLIVDIEGPQSVVKGISEAATDLIDIGGLCEDRTFTTPLVFKERTVTAQLTEVEVKVEVDPVLVEKTFNDVPVTVSVDGWTIDPATARIVLAGPAGLLAGLPPQSVHVTANVPEGATAGTTVKVDLVEKADSPVVVTVDGSDESIAIKRVEPTRFALVPPK